MPAPPSTPTRSPAAPERSGEDAASAFERVIVTDTVPVNPLTKPDNVAVLSISGLLAVVRLAQTQACNGHVLCRRI